MEKVNTDNIKEKLEKELSEMQKQLESIQLEEFNKEIEPVKKEIDILISDKYMCGVLISKQLILQLIDNMIVNNKPIFLQYELYKK